MTVTVRVTAPFPSVPLSPEKVGPVVSGMSPDGAPEGITTPVPVPTVWPA